MGRKQNLTAKVKENAWAWKPIAICVVIIFIAVGITAYFTASDRMEQTKQTPEYQMALDYLQSQTFIDDKYGSESPTYVGSRYENLKDEPERYVFTFVYNHVPILNLGDHYDVELNCINGQWVVIGIVD